MNKLKLLFILLILPTGFLPLHATPKNPVPATDSFCVTPGQSPNILFGLRFAGELIQKNDSTWIITGNSDREAAHFGVRLKTAVHTAPLKFDDCVYFYPPDQACINAEINKSLTPHFFIRRSDHSRSSNTVPASVRFYLDTSTLVPSLNNRLATDTFPESLAAEYLHPFYFRKYEVTNAEYRAFVQWVTDSIARTRLRYFLPNGTLDRKKKYNLYHHHTDSITRMLLPKSERFFSRNQVDARKLNYRFQNRPVEFSSDSVNIYPDTLLWTKDFSFWYNEPMRDMYFWHPAYDDYPVTCLSYWQCLAFLEWKSIMLTKQFGAQYKIVCALPSEMEWDYATTAEMEQGSLRLVGESYYGTSDDSWLTDLALSRSGIKQYKIYNAGDVAVEDSVSNQVLRPVVLDRPSRPAAALDDQYDQPMRRLELDNEKMWGDFVYDGYFHTGPAKIFPNGFAVKKPKNEMQQPNERSMAHYDDATGICWMDGNVSEWMREDLDRNWRGIFLKHCVVPDGPYAEEQKQVVAYEKFYYDRLPQHGKLVRGCNWYDERFAMKYGKNVGGTQAKTFESPYKAHCTLGFRYVIYLLEK